MRAVLQKALNAKTGKGFPSLLEHAREMLDAGQASLPWAHPVLPSASAVERWARVLEDAELRAQVVERALREADIWSQRYHDLAELADVVAAVEAAKVKAKVLRRKKAA